MTTTTTDAPVTFEDVAKDEATLTGTLARIAEMKADEDRLNRAIANGLAARLELPRFSGRFTAFEPSVELSTGCEESTLEVQLPAAVCG